MEWPERAVEAGSGISPDDEHGNAELPEPSESIYLGPLLAGLNIGYWTSVPVTNHFAANAIVKYLDGDHEVLGLFDTMSFLNDVLHLRDDHCSAFFVNCILAFASQVYYTTDSSAAERRLQFEAEAHTLWRANPDDHELTVAGLMLLCLSRGSHGHVENSKIYIREASNMAKRLKLFGVEDALDAEQVESLSEAAQRTLAQITWGCIQPVKVRFDYPPARRRS